MSEIRQDITTGEWTIIAEDRSLRPFQNALKGKSNNESSKDCPFCPGSEKNTPKEIYALRSKGSSNSPGWQVRVVPNKFPALTDDITLIVDGSKLGHDLYPHQQGFGYHEVIIETPDHTKHMALLNPIEIEHVLKTIHTRYHHLQQDPRVRFIFPFRNHGIKAGASIAHPHCQILATPVIPMHSLHRFELAFDYFKKTKESLFSKILKNEQKIFKRVVLESSHFIVFCPYASRAPFEIWILPKKIKPHFGCLSIGEMKDLAVVLRQSLMRLNKALKNPDYNLAMISAPHLHKMTDDQKAAFSWHIKIYPRLSSFAGFEIGTGMTINTVSPENATKILKDISI